MYLGRKKYDNHLLVQITSILVALNRHVDVLNYELISHRSSRKNITELRVFYGVIWI